MTVSTFKAGLVGAIALATLAPSALASGVSITTDRVQLQVGNNGQVIIRTLADRPYGVPEYGVSQFAAPQGTVRLPGAAPLAVPGCTARSHSAHSTRSTVGGNVVYSENRSTTRVCQ